MSSRTSLRHHLQLESRLHWDELSNSLQLGICLLLLLREARRPLNDVGVVDRSSTATPFDIIQKMEQVRRENGMIIDEKLQPAAAMEPEMKFGSRRFASKSTTVVSSEYGLFRI
ncbi:hypothetical protein Nepgr_017585 [Nepenthes gracilis]|uniref:Uncharacterized protein n=1 Tax=Nepenthes gracilis TaxID=150966 RepID=A0AAD3SRX0_NEPGR|nr:hypothetical protein Nepgr_017585 [Nepenthes gracilis]